MNRFPRGLCAVWRRRRSSQSQVSFLFLGRSPPFPRDSKLSSSNGSVPLFFFVLSLLECKVVIICYFSARLWASESSPTAQSPLPGLLPESHLRDPSVPFIASFLLLFILLYSNLDRCWSMYCIDWRGAKTCGHIESKSCSPPLLFFLPLHSFSLRPSDGSFSFI